MSRAHRLDRQDVLDLLAAYREQAPHELDERIDSMELAWLLSQVEQRYGTELDLDDDAMARMTTVPAALRELREALERGGGATVPGGAAGPAGHPDPGGPPAPAGPPALGGFPTPGGALEPSGAPERSGDG